MKYFYKTREKGTHLWSTNWELMNGVGKTISVKNTKLKQNFYLQDFLWSFQSVFWQSRSQYLTCLHLVQCSKTPLLPQFWQVDFSGAGWLQKYQMFNVWSNYKKYFCGAHFLKQHTELELFSQFVWISHFF